MKIILCSTRWKYFHQFVIMSKICADYLANLEISIIFRLSNLSLRNKELQTCYGRSRKLLMPIIQIFWKPNNPSSPIFLERLPCHFALNDRAKIGGVLSLDVLSKFTPRRAFYGEKLSCANCHELHWGKKWSFSACTSKRMKS